MNLIPDTIPSPTQGEGRLGFWTHFISQIQAMEGLQANITATCPSAFHGATGQLFAAAVTSMVAAHCAIFEDNQWPRDRAEEVILNGPKTFDFVVVGAGTAGSALAGLLSQHNPEWSVLLVEAGDDPGLNSEVPAFLLYNQDINWGYRTRPDSSSCLGSINNECLWSKGKAMGGSSSINAMLYVRGHPKDFQNWEDSGNTGWGYGDVSRYFDDIEKKLDLASYKYNENPWYNILDKAYEEVGLYKSVIDNNENNIGTRIVKLSTRNGKRLNTAKLYLKERDNLYVIKNTIVQRVVIDPLTNVATGIQIQHRNGFVMQIAADKEVILSAGSIATPKILLLSGIGPRHHLNEKGIECLADLPVGQNLQDHVLVPLDFKTNQQNVITPEMITFSLLQYMLTKTGPLSNIGLVDYMSFIDTRNVSDYPDIQFHHMHFAKNDLFTLRSYLGGFGFNEEVINAIAEISKLSDILGVYPTLLHPKSKGEVRLADANPDSEPDIITNYYKDPEDMKTFFRAINAVKILEETDTFQNNEIKLVPLKLKGCSNFVLDSDEYWECYVRHLGVTIYHPVGTAKMGPKDDSTAVVNDHLFVYGVKNLRVVDASIMPSITSGNTMAPTLVIAEKAFDLMIKEYGFRDEL